MWRGNVTNDVLTIFLLQLLINKLEQNKNLSVKDKEKIMQVRFYVTFNDLLLVIYIK